MITIYRDVLKSPTSMIILHWASSKYHLSYAFHILSKQSSRPDHYDPNSHWQLNFWPKSDAKMDKEHDILKLVSKSRQTYIVLQHKQTLHAIIVHYCTQDVFRFTPKKKKKKKALQPLFLTNIGCQKGKSIQCCLLTVWRFFYHFRKN